MKPFITLILILIAVFPALAEDTPTDDEIIERIVELQRQLDELMATLSPEARQRLNERLAASPPAAAETSAETASVEPVAPAPVPVPAEAPPPVIAEAAAAPAAAPPQPEPQKPLARKRLSRGPHCNFLEFLDSNEDGKISAFDRYWRHLYLWQDANGNRQVEDDEVESPYDLKVREIAVDLDLFIFKKGHIGEIRVDGFVSLDVRGDGLGGGNDRVLVVDATKLGRRSGPRLVGTGDQPLVGLQPFQAGWRIEQEGGESTVLECP